VCSPAARASGGVDHLVRSGPAVPRCLVRDLRQGLAARSGSATSSAHRASADRAARTARLPGVRCWERDTSPVPRSTSRLAVSPALAPCAVARGLGPSQVVCPYRGWIARHVAGAPGRVTPAAAPPTAPARGRTGSEALQRTAGRVGRSTARRFGRRRGRSVRACIRRTGRADCCAHDSASLWSRSRCWGGRRLGCAGLRSVTRGSRGGARMTYRKGPASLSSRDTGAPASVPRHGDASRTAGPPSR